MNSIYNTQALLNDFDNDFSYTLWLLDQDSVYANSYSELRAELEQSCIESDDAAWPFLLKMEELRQLYDERLKNVSSWVAPKKYAANALVHDDSGKLTQKSIELLQKAISDKNGEKTLISDTGKTVSFGTNWHRMIQSCEFRPIAIDKLTDFISKFIEADGWSKYFIGNIGKNNKSQIQEYHVMDKYNLKHSTKYAALHLGGNTTRCVLLSVDTGTEDGKGEPGGITFLEIGAHTIIDRFIVGSFKHSSGKPITEATAEELAVLLDIN